VVFIIGWLIHCCLLAHVTGARAAPAEAEGHYAQIILTLGVGPPCQRTSAPLALRQASMPP
jgi:hypothetical protein